LVVSAPDYARSTEAGLAVLTEIVNFFSMSLDTVLFISVLICHKDKESTLVIQIFS